MTKKDLRDGMIVETRGGKRYLVMNGCRVARRVEGYIILENQRIDLTYPSDDYFTIDKVYANDNDVFDLRSMFENPGKLLWARTTTKEMTLEEIEKELGHKVKLVDTRPNREFKVGDAVRIRQWDDMEKEFGVNWRGTIHCDGAFVVEMKNLCGRKCTIKDIIDNTVKLDFEDRTGDIHWKYTKDMIEHI